MEQTTHGGDVAEAAVRRFVANYRGVPYEEVRLSHRLDVELGIDGADAAEFLEAFAKVFGGNPIGERFDDYFGPEGFDPIGEAWRFLRRHCRWRKSLTVSDLVRFVVDR